MGGGGREAGGWCREKFQTKSRDNQPPTHIMPFLLPALIAIICDICVIWLSSYTQHYDTTVPPDGSNRNDTIDNGSNGDSDHWVLYTIDLYCGSVAALLRLCIVCIPLLYHSYTGTAIRYTLWYRTIYIGMALLVILHVTTYIIVQPEAIEFLVILPTTSPQYEYRRLWLILLFSSVSLIFHRFLLRHVRSTAPTPPMMLRMLNHRQMDANNNPRSSYYFLCGNYIHNTVQPTMYFAVRTAAAAAAAAAASTTSKTTTGNSVPKNASETNTTSVNATLSALPNLTFNSYRDTEGETHNGGMEQEPALINAMNGMFLFVNLPRIPSI